MRRSSRIFQTLIGAPMTQPLLNLSTGLLRFESQIYHFKVEASKIALSEESYPEEKFRQIKDECNALQTERNLLRTEFDKIKQTLKEPIQDALWNKFDSLNKKYSKVNDKLSSNYSIHVTSRKIDDLFSQYGAVNTIKDPDLKQLDKIKQETLEIMKQPKLKTLQLQKVIQVHDTIENEQNIMVEEQLDNLHCFIQLAIHDPHDPNFYMGNVKEMFNEKLPSCALGRQVRNDLITQLRRDICTQWGLTFRTLHSQNSLDLTSNPPVFDNLPKLAQVISEHPLFKLAYPTVDDKGYATDDSDGSMPGLEDELQAATSPETPLITHVDKAVAKMNLLSKFADEDPYNKPFHLE
jgi:hypothetical protein